MNRTFMRKAAARSTAVMFAIIISGLAVPANAETPGSNCRPRLESLELPTDKVHSGAKASGTVRLTCPARRATSVTLTSADTAWVSLPPQVTIPAGQAAATVPIETHQPDYLNGAFSVALTARLHHQKVSRPLELQPGLRLLSLESPVTSGDSVWLQLGINGSAPEGGTTITLESDNPALRLPPTITIPHGALGRAGSMGKTVRIPQDADVTVTAKLPGQSKTANVVVKAWTYDPGEWSLTGPQSMYGGGFYYDMHLDLPNPVPHGGVDVTFSSDDPRMNLPGPINFVEGTSGRRNFQISAQDNLDRDVKVTAEIEGVGTRSFTVRVHPGIREITMPWPLYGGESGEGTLHLGTTTSEPLTIQMSSSNPILHLPGEVTVPAGSSTATFPITTDPVNDFQAVLLTATLGQTYLQTDVFIQPAP